MFCFFSLGPILWKSSFCRSEKTPKQNITTGVVSVDGYVTYLQNIKYKEQNTLTVKTLWDDWCQ